jgi:hypothetical protein
VGLLAALPQLTVARRYFEELMFQHGCNGSRQRDFPGFEGLTISRSCDTLTALHFLQNGEVVMDWISPGAG